MKKKQAFSLALAGAMAVTVLAPTTAMADTTWGSPSSAMTVDNNIAKVGIHAAASTASFFLGGNVVAERASDYSSITGKATAQEKYEAAMAFTRLGAFGSSSNVSPDPYLWNYFYNLAVDAGQATGTKSQDEVYISTGAGSPMQSDTAVIESLGTSYTLDRRPDVLMDTAGGYADLIAQLPENKDDDPSNDYNPISLSYVAANFASFVDDMYNLSDAIKASGKQGRYGDTEEIAEKYELYMKGIQCYVLSKIADGTVAKKNVAVITDAVDTDDDGTNDAYLCVDNTVTIGTSTDRPSESIYYTANNILQLKKDDLKSFEREETNRGKTTKVTYQVATAAQLAEMDAIIYGGHNADKGEGLRKELMAAGIAEDKIPMIYDSDPSDVFTIRANSVENFAGVGIFNGWLYPEILNPVDCTMYIYETFWHLKESELQKFAQANFANATVPDSIKTDGSTYDKAQIEDMIAQGMAYYAKHASEYTGTTLEVTDRINPAEYTKVSLTAGDKSATVTAAQIDALGQEQTFTKNGKNGSTEITANFAKLADVLTEAGLSTEAGCHFVLTASDGFSVNIAKGDLDTTYLYLDKSSGLLYSASGNPEAAGKMWVKDLTSVATSDIHTFENDVCTICGDPSTDKALADSVTAQIQALPETATAADQAAVEAASKAYTDLTDTQKAMVAEDVVAKLTTAEAQVKEAVAKAEAEKKAAAEKAAAEKAAAEKAAAEKAAAEKAAAEKAAAEKAAAEKAAEKKASTITLKAKTATYTGKAIAIAKATVKGSTGKVTYKYYSDKACKKAVKAANVKKAGIYYVKATVAADANYKAATSKAVVLKIKKAANPVMVAVKPGNVKYNKKKAQKLAAKKIFTVTKAQGKVTYTKISGNKNITISKTGVITVKKKTAKKTYSIKVKVTAAGNANYLAKNVTKTIKVKVKK